MYTSALEYNFSLKKGDTIALFSELHRKVFFYKQESDGLRLFHARVQKTNSQKKTEVNPADLCVGVKKDGSFVVGIENVPQLTCRK